ncbi:MAG: dihydroxy-acid dehydratase [Rhodospirillaceae bacterium]|jgi:dihydroxy-acid dehydratase|nr:dihydroxy-acid dehydratase [Rhodospirillaceae bacterium]MBT3494256.1 dihydroxy-acid dehydratase [Rhodospirillaceae bacterium]MBT3778664.1 dihydroxy-acid dehydratase [Rhodospirillaceae bacterium]MBT3979203.1 dihydroxy-acid dehydratase [Rhodospirillaceae bacterium]MBT4170734.1 dihydroxy-acid dehydratase [Rhodospirillaceae bacterium]
MTRKKPDELRSHRWFGVDDLRAFGHRSRAKQMGYSTSDFAGKPVIAIINTWSDLNACHMHLRQRAEEVKRGVWQAGGFPVELPAMSLAEPIVKPTTMLYRNFLAMEVEELIRSHPIDGVVLMGGCDKTTPALLMAATSMDLPTIFFPAGPALRGNWAGNTLGTGSDAWKFWAERRAGRLDAKDWDAIESGISRSPGTCMTMGTASTMTAIAEALGLILPGGSSIPAADSSHARLASESGRRIVEMTWEDEKISDFLDERAFRNAMRLAMAYGGSTNAAVHILAMAGRAKVDIKLDDLDAVAREVPLLANVRPSGKYLMEDFYYAGGIRALMARLSHLLELDAPTVSGKSLGENIAGAEVYDDDVIRPLDNPVSDQQTMAILRGNLAPTGAVLKPIAADPKLLNHTGPALVFDDYNDMAARIDSDDLDVTADSVLILRNSGPQGGPGMPEWGMLPIPKKLLQQGVNDMVRLSDARMSGTSYGTCVLHVSPESFVGGPLAFVQTGDMIKLDVPARRLDLMIDDAEFEKRKAAWTAPAPRYSRGFGAIYAQHVTQADQGCDFEILRDGEAVPEPEIH